MYRIKIRNKKNFNYFSCFFFVKIMGRIALTLVHYCSRYSIDFEINFTVFWFGGCESASLDVVRSLSSWAPPLRDIPGISRKNKSRSPGFWDFRDFSFGIFSGFFSGFFRDFLGISSVISNLNPDPRDFGIFGISHSGFFRDFLEV